MRSKGLIALLLVTLAAVIVAVFVGRGGTTARDDPLAGTPVLPDVAKHLGDVTRLALVHGGMKTTLVRWGDLWTVEERGFYSADGVKVRQALLGLADARLVEPKTRKADLYPRIEVEDADKKDAKSILVTVTDKKGTLLGEVILGKHRVDQLGGGEDGIYVRKPGDAQSWLARGTLNLDGDLPSWLDRKLLDVPTAQIKSVTLTAAAGGNLAISRLKADDKFALAVAPPAGKHLKSDTILDEPAGALVGLDLTDVRPAAGFDFPKDGNAQARYETFDGMVVSITIAAKDGMTWLRIAASGTGTAEKPAADLNAKFSPWLFSVADAKVKTLETKLDDVVEAAKGS
jgi:hypothetical protein